MSKRKVYVVEGHYLISYDNPKADTRFVIFTFCFFFTFPFSLVLLLPKISDWIGPKIGKWIEGENDEA
jgi:hypothetical protein